jgi:hypothetical protein
MSAPALSPLPADAASATSTAVAMAQDLGSDLEYLNEVTLPAPQRGRPKRIQATVVRHLTALDVPAILADKSEQPVWTLQSIRHTHHQAAQLMAQGKPDFEVGAITGYNPAYLAQLRSSPAFQELLAHYGHQREQVFVDTLKRMQSLGLSTLEELQERLALEPATFGNQDLLDMAKLMLVEPAKVAAMAKGHSGVGGGGTTSIKVEFVTPSQAASVTIDQLPAAQPLELE